MLHLTLLCNSLIPEHPLQLNEFAGLLDKDRNFFCCRPTKCPLIYNTPTRMPKSRNYNSNFGIVIHSASEVAPLWHKVEDKKNKVGIIWTVMSPGSDDKEGAGLNGIVELILLRM